MYQCIGSSSMVKPLLILEVLSIIPRAYNLYWTNERYIDMAWGRGVYVNSSIHDEWALVKSSPLQGSWLFHSI